MAHVTKVMKYQLIYLDGGGDFSFLQDSLWKIQHETREILNRTIREKYLSAAEKQKFAEKALYNRFRDEYPDMNSSIVNATIRKAKDKYGSLSKDILRGTVSLPSFKSGQPILLHDKSVAIDAVEQDYIATLSLFSTQFKKTYPNVDRPRFKLIIKDGTQRSIVQRLFSGEYTLGQCQLSYDKPKWFLSLTYKFDSIEKPLDEEKTLGVDLGCAYALYASSYGNRGVFKIPGDEITAFERKQAAMQNRKPKSTLERVEELEDRRWAKQQQARYCGEGRTGHGTKTRVGPVYEDRDKIARFRDTINHRYSKALVEYAAKNGYGIIQMEDLSGIKEDTGFPKRLQHWTYFDLQTKIEYKAKERGISVIKINPRYTSQRCSRCGHIDRNNRQTQSAFKCTTCGFSGNADYNASQNISIPGIADIIKETSDEKSANKKQT